MRVRLRARSQFRAGWPPLLGLSPPPVSRPVRPPLPVWPPRLQVRCGQATGLAAALRSSSRLTASFRPCFKLSRLLHPRPAPLAGVPLDARRLSLPFSRLPLSGWPFSLCHWLLGPAFSLPAGACVSAFCFCTSWCTQPSGCGRAALVCAPPGSAHGLQALLPALFGTPAFLGCS